jgi:hypothetical protein
VGLGRVMRGKKGEEVVGKGIGQEEMGGEV